MQLAERTQPCGACALPVKASETLQGQQNHMGEMGWWLSHHPKVRRSLVICKSFKVEDARVATGAHAWRDKRTSGTLLESNREKVPTQESQSEAV